jgi:hypothetical protein
MSFASKFEKFQECLSLCDVVVSSLHSSMTAARPATPTRPLAATVTIGAKLPVADEAAEEAALPADEAAEPAAFVALEICEEMELPTEAAEDEADAPTLEAAEEADAALEEREEATLEAETLAPEAAEDAPEEALEAALEAPEAAEPCKTMSTPSIKVVGGSTYSCTCNDTEDGRSSNCACDCASTRGEGAELSLGGDCA